MTKRILRSLRIDKVAAVDRPCQEHASADIMKRAEDFDDTAFLLLGKRTFSADQRREAAASGAAMPGGRYPIENVEDLHNAIHAIGRGSGSHAAIRAHIISRARALGATDQLPADWKKVAPTESQMLKELAKALGLPDTATEADITKALTDNMAKAATTAEALAKVQADLAKANDELAKAKKPMPSDNDGDEDCGPDGVAKGLAFQTMDGKYISKKMAGAMFDVLKSQDAQLRTNAETLAKREEESAVANFAKRATDIGFGDAFGPTLRKAYGGDATAQAEVEKRIKGLQEQVAQGKLFKNFGGGGGPEAGSAEEEFLAKVEEVKKANPDLSHAQAFSKAYTDPATADIRKRMREEANA